VGDEYGGFACNTGLGIPDGAMYLRLQPTLPLRVGEKEFPMDTSEKHNLDRLDNAARTFLDKPETILKLDQLKRHMGEM
jgi:hypothetical protein